MIYEEVLNAVIGMAETATGENIVIGSNPPLGKIAMTGFSAPSSIFLDIGSNERMPVSVNGKSSSQEEVSGWLNTIHETLTRRKDFPTGESWQIYAIETIASPRLIGKEANPRASWIYGSTLLVKFNTKGIDC